MMLPVVLLLMDGVSGGATHWQQPWDRGDAS